jgi:hypothetical protein
MKGVIYMKLITEAQKHEIEKLAGEHGEALIAYGADMYHKGAWDFAKWGIIGATCMCIAFHFGRELIDEHMKQKEQIES